MKANRNKPYRTKGTVIGTLLLLTYARGTQLFLVTGCSVKGKCTGLRLVSRGVFGRADGRYPGQWFGSWQPGSLKIDDERIIGLAPECNHCTVQLTSLQQYEVDALPEDARLAYKGWLKQYNATQRRRALNAKLAAAGQGSCATQNAQEEAAQAAVDAQEELEPSDGKPRRYRVTYAHQGVECSHDVVSTSRQLAIKQVGAIVGSHQQLVSCRWIKVYRCRSWTKGQAGRGECVITHRDATTAEEAAQLAVEGLRKLVPGLDWAAGGATICEGRHWV